MEIVEAGAEISRRGFLGGFCAGAAGLILPANSHCTENPRMRFGVVSDVHIRASGVWDWRKYTEHALRWFDAQGVDAVMVPGDIAHSGLIQELKGFAEIWDKVFKDGKKSDGRPVERLFVTGNHDVEAFWVKGDDGWRRQNVVSHGDNLAKLWRELFHEDYRPIWKKQVKGYTFIGAQWRCNGMAPPIEQWFREHAGELEGDKPFFYTQHAHPRGTCGDGKISYDDGTATRALSQFPNAVAITGHSHQTIVDESSAWQGSFTSINAGCLREGGNDRKGVYDSTYPPFSQKRKANRMRPIPAQEGRCGLLVDVFDDHILVNRRSFEYDTALGEDWCIPLPAKPGGKYDVQRRKKEDAGPIFPEDAKIEVKWCDVAPVDIAGPALAGKPCVRVRIPHPSAAKPGSRVYDFKVDMLVDGKVEKSRLVLANGYNVPLSLSDRPSDCLFGADELPNAGAVRFRVAPRTCFGTSGKTIVSDVIVADR